MDRAQASESIEEQIEARRSVYLEQLSGEERRLYEIDRELASQRSVLSPDALAERRRRFEEQVQAVQQLSQQKRRELDEMAAAARDEVRQALVEVVGELAEERDFNLVLPRASVLLFSPRLDISDEVLERLDERLPSVEIEPAP